MHELPLGLLVELGKLKSSALGPIKSELESCYTLPLSGISEVTFVDSVG
jgi:hypothetical protein